MAAHPAIYEVLPDCHDEHACACLPDIGDGAVGLWFSSVALRRHGVRSFMARADQMVGIF
jgi:hypothetical protein